MQLRRTALVFASLLLLLSLYSVDKMEKVLTQATRANQAFGVALVGASACAALACIAVGAGPRADGVKLGATKATALSSIGAVAALLADSALAHYFPLMDRPIKQACTWAAAIGASAAAYEVLEEGEEQAIEAAVCAARDDEGTAP
eukprot:scaffold8.g1649.t1